MSSYNETGHFKNVSNFEDLIAYCSAYGSNYNPAQTTIQLSALQQFQLNALNCINSLYAKNAAYKNAVSARIIAFDPLKKFSTNVLNAYMSFGPNDQNISNVKYYVNKIRGNAKKKVKTADATNGTATTEAVTHSTSQQSFDSMVEHYSGLISLLSTDSLYQPNEYELSIKGLQDLLGSLKAKNTDVINAQTALNNARIERDEMLYADSDGLVDKATYVKKYVKAIFGSSSSQFKQISSIKFKATSK